MTIDNLKLKRLYRIVSNKKIRELSRQFKLSRQFLALPKSVYYMPLNWLVKLNTFSIPFSHPPNTDRGRTEDPCSAAQRLTAEPHL